jgi:hypothetical protein
VAQIQIVKGVSGYLILVVAIRLDGCDSMRLNHFPGSNFDRWLRDE